MKTKVNTSFNLDANTRKELKLLAINLDMTATEVIEMLLKHYKNSKGNK